MMNVVTDELTVVAGFVIQRDIVAVSKTLGNPPTGLGGVALGYACDQFLKGLCCTSP
jgi:hypothetical protein